MVQLFTNKFKRIYRAENEIFITNMKRYTLKMDEKDTLFLVSELGVSLPTLSLLDEIGEKKVLAFYGSMGVGKTTFLKQLCSEMGTEDVVNSPTFAIVNVYELDGVNAQRFGKEIYHFDCYRIKDIREAQDFGAEEYLYSGNYCFIEWPEMINALLPDDLVKITITPQENGDRQLTIE